jgi:hypothetical protein
MYHMRDAEHSVDAMGIAQGTAMLNGIDNQCNDNCSSSTTEQVRLFVALSSTPRGSRS